MYYSKEGPFQIKEYEKITQYIYIETEKVVLYFFF